MLDRHNRSKIDLAHPKLRGELENLIQDINENILTGNSKVRITHSLRTWKEQDDLYAQGRTKPGKKVTNAKGGDSYHNYAIAVDICLIINGVQASWDVKKDWDQDKQSDWMEVVKAFKDKGWKWGGDWVKFKDMPHFEKTFGFTVKQLKEKYLRKDFIAGTEYVRI